MYVQPAGILHRSTGSVQPALLIHHITPLTLDTIDNSQVQTKEAFPELAYYYYSFLNFPRNTHLIEDQLSRITANMNTVGSAGPASRVS